MKPFRTVVLAVITFILFIPGKASALAMVESWAVDPASGGRICIMLWDDSQKLVSATWSGPVAAGKAEGKGLLQYVYIDRNGTEIKALSEAEMKAGKLDGKTSIKWSDGNSFDGHYEKGFRNGAGVFRYANGCVYEGEYKNGIIDGQGFFKWPDGTTYEGDWKNGVQEGRGIEKKANGEIYEGEFKNAQKAGIGAKTWPNGATYEGEWKNDLPEGRGTARLANGDTFQGEFKNGAFDGQGTYRWASGNIYKGQFKNGLRDGLGIMTDASGKVFGGWWWKEDKPLAETATVKTNAVLGVPWGASEEEAKRIMQQRPQTEYLSTRREEKQSVQNYMGPFNNEQTAISIFFHEGKMFQVVVTHHLSENRLQSKFNELKSGMSQHYGPPVKESGERLSAMALWDLGGDYKAGIQIKKTEPDQTVPPFKIQLAYWRQSTYFLVHPEEKPSPETGPDF